LPASVAELNREAAARTSGEDAWADPRPWYERIFDVFKKK
jgi:hypothetical protein